MADKAQFFGFSCPKCGSPMRPMKNNNGYSCAAPGNVYLGNGKWSICDGVKWNKNKNPYLAKDPIARATAFPVIANPTDEQAELRKVMGTSPKVRGGRCLIVDAGPGTGKTTTISWSMEAVYQRLGNLVSYGMRAFNVNASEVLLSKLPPVVSDVSTLNSAGGRAQGYKGRNYDTAKSYRLFKDLTSHIAEKDRPHFGKLGKVLERTRDCCLFTTADDVGGWKEIIATVLARFPSLAKKVAGQEKFILEYLPMLAQNCLAEKGKIDLQEQLTRPVTEAQAKTGWKMPCDLVLKKASEWTDEDVAHFAKLVKSIDLPQVQGLVVDEAQDLSLAQIATTLAQTWRNGELTVIGDDMFGEPGEEGYKAGQAIYGWRGAFGGSMALIARLWEALTGETALKRSLTITFRHSEEICAAYRPLNTVIRSGRESGYSAAYTVGGNSAFEAWLNLPKGMTALWITRTNASIVPVFMDTLRECQDCTIRGGRDFAAAVESALYEAAGVPNEQSGEYKVSLADCLINLQRIINEQSAEEGEIDPNSMESFLLGVGEAIVEQPEMLIKAELHDKVLSVANLKRFVTYFADRNSRRVLTTVYRCKGDEADLAVVADTEKFNESWGCSYEAAACRHVAASRAKRLALFVGYLSGTVAGKPDDDEVLVTTLQPA